MSVLPAALLPHRADVERPRTTLANDAGGFVETPTTQATIPCRIVDGVPSDRTRGQERFASATHTIYTRADADVQRGDVIAFEGRRFKVLGTLHPSKRGHHGKVIAEEQQRAAPTEA